MGKSNLTEEFLSSYPAIKPLDATNFELLGHVRPQDHINIQPPQRPYDIVVIGGGTAGLVSAGAAALLGLRVALIEKHLLGGDCLNTGCVPSKALLDLAKHAKTGRFSFSQIMDEVRKRRVEVAPHDSVKRFSDMNIDIYFGSAQFESRNVVKVNDQAIRFKRCVIATGARAKIPEIEGIQDVPFLTNESVFSLQKKPRRFCVLGGGPIGSEMAQAFACLGSQVDLIETHERILSREDPDASMLVEASFKELDIRLHKRMELVKTSMKEGEIHLALKSKETGQISTLYSDALLVATGRSPNVNDLRLTEVGIESDRNRGVKIDDYFRTSQSNIYACGDVADYGDMPAKFTHAADASARLAVQNIILSLLKPVQWLSGMEHLVFPLFGGRRKQLLIPRCTYTKPEIASVGDCDQITETIQIRFADIDRTIVEHATNGFLKIGLDQKKRICAATIVGDQAGEILPLLTMAIQKRKKIKWLGQIIYAYPTRSEIMKVLADEWTMRQLPRLKKVISPILPS